MRSLFNAAVLALAIAVGGCTSYSELREMPPLVAKTLPGSRAVIAACTADELRLRNDMLYVVNDRPDQQATRIAAGVPTLVGTPTGSYAWEIKFTDGAPDLVTVEVRAVKSIFGKPAYPSDLFDIVQGCAGPHLAASDSPTKR